MDYARQVVCKSSAGRYINSVKNPKKHKVLAGRPALTRDLPDPHACSTAPPLTRPITTSKFVTSSLLFFMVLLLVGKRKGKVGILGLTYAALDAFVKSFILFYLMRLFSNFENPLYFPMHK